MSGCRFTITKEIARKIVAIRKAESLLLVFKKDWLVGNEAWYAGEIVGWKCRQDETESFVLFGEGDEEFTNWLKKYYPEFFL